MSIEARVAAQKRLAASAPPEPRRLTTEEKREVAHATGARFVPIDGGQRLDGWEWVRMGYAPREAPDRVEVYDPRERPYGRRTIEQAITETQEFLAQEIRKREQGEAVRHRDFERKFRGN